MSKLQIRNVGPIKNACGTEYIHFNSLTVFLGPQGSGKSTLAKVYSSLAWLEKAILREEVTQQQCEEDSFFLNHVIAYQGIQSYFQENSYLHFIGKGCEFTYKNGKFTVSKLDNESAFKMPKIMYVPAERNFLTAITRPEFIKGLPKPLHSFLAEYEQAKEWVAQQEENKILLPVGELNYYYDKESSHSLLVGDGFKTELLHGSSGFQSLVPLFVVTEYLANLVANKKDDPTYEFFSVIQKENKKNKVVKLLESYKGKKPTSENLKAMLNIINQVEDYYQYKSFVNIVEEPEQNLYPESQKKVLFNLIENLNKTKENKLVITSHSPYILNFITLCTEAYKIHQQKNLGLAAASVLESIVPKQASLNIDKVNAYEIDTLGNIKLLNKEHGLIDDAHSLNRAFEKINEDFSSLLDME